MKWKFLSLMIFLLVLPTLILSTVNAEIQTLGNFPKDNSIQLTQVCDNCTYVNLTKVTLPDSVAVNINDVMEKDDTFYNYTFSTTSQLGDYIYTTCGDPDGVRTCVSVSFSITNAGHDISTGESIIYVVFSLVILFAFFLCLYGAIQIPFRNTVNDEGKIISINDMKYLKVVCIIFSYLLLLFIFGITKSIMENFLFINGAYKVFQWLYSFMFAFVWPLIVLSLLFTLILFLESTKIKKALQRGVPIR